MAARAHHVDDNSPSPAELRSRLGANLRQLSGKAESISALCRDLGINRTQYNRYLAGESFPRPDVLDRICNFFEVDARILLAPVETLDRPEGSALHSDYLKDFIDDMESETSSARRFSREAERFIDGIQARGSPQRAAQT